MNVALIPKCPYIAGAMFGRLFANPSKSVPHDLYGRVVTQSRMTVFYEELRIPDTVAGRYDILSLHLFLLSHALTKFDNPLAGPLNQEIFDIFTANIDDALRQLGIGDTSVPKRKKRLIHQFYGHIGAFEHLLENRDETNLCNQVDARFYGSADHARAVILARYMIAANKKLLATSFDEILHGRFDWPDSVVQWEDRVRQ